MTTGGLDDVLERIVQEELERCNPELAERHSRLANRAVQKGDYVKAAENLQVAFNFDPKPEYLRRKGDALLHLRMLLESFEAHKVAAELELRAQGGRLQAAKIRPQVHERLRAESCRIISEVYSDWTKETSEDPEESYAKAHTALEGLVYDLEDIVLFLRKHGGTGFKIGLFLSALTNRIIRDNDILILEVKDYTDFVGAFHERGTLRIKSLSGPHNFYWRHFAYGMRGGKGIIEDGPGEGYGNHMCGGELVIEGEVSWGGLCDMQNGHAIILTFTDPKRRSYSGSFNEIGTRQSGGLIEIHDDVPRFITHLSRDQVGGVLNVDRNVDCEQVGSGKADGKTTIGSFTGKNHIDPFLGYGMSGGNVIIKEDAGSACDCRRGRVLVGFHQKGGTITIGGDAYGSLASGARLGSHIEVEGNVNGEIGGYETTGAEIIVWGNMNGNIGGGASGMQCVIKGSVNGNVWWFGKECKEDRKRNGRIEVFGDVCGDIGDLIYKGSEVVVHGNVNGKVGGLIGGTVKVDGKIKEVIPSLAGKVYEGSKDVTKIEMIASIFRFLGFHIRGDE